MEIREKNGKRFNNCLECDDLDPLNENCFECKSPKTGYHRYDNIFRDSDGLVHFPVWCPLLRIDNPGENAL